MFGMIKENIKNFLDIRAFLIMIAVGLYTIAIDYKYFKKLKFRKDAIVSFGIGVGCIILPFALLLISKL